MKITSDFPGGNIKLLSIQDNIINLEQELRGTSEWWFYWCFLVDEPLEGEYIFRFHNKEVVCPHGPATSTDGVNWSWHEEGFIDHMSFKYVFGKNEKSRYFSFSIPYTCKDFEHFWDSIEGIERSVLCKSEDGRDIPFVTFGEGDKNVFFIARHHCCESTASFALEGIVSAALSMPYLYKNFKFHVFPFADIDGVEKGEQGKNRAPHDHNRDYIDEPIYAFTRAVKEYTMANRPVFFIDMHSPWKWGRRNDAPHIFVSPDMEPDSQMQNDFISWLMDITQNAAISYDGYTVSFDAEKTTSSKYFYKMIGKASLAITIETPYSGNGEQGYSIASLREWGENIALALEKTARQYHF